MSTDPTPHDEPAPPTSRLWWVMPGAGFILLVLLASLFGGGPETVGYGTSYDASDGGFRGGYLLLEELGYPVERSRRPGGGEVRWVLAPGKVTTRDAQSLDDWIQRGGAALLALENTELAEHLGLRVSIKSGGLPGSVRPFGLSSHGESRSLPTHAPDVSTIRTGAIEVSGPPGGRTWGEVDGQPLVTIYPHGRGQVWLLHRPDVFDNANLRQDDNAVLAARLAEAMLREKPGGKLAFDEYVHGLRDRPSATELLFRPPVLAVTLQVLLLGALALWRSGVRFGAPRTALTPPRRSKEEFLDAMAELLKRNGNREEAYRTVRDAVLRRLEDALGLPTGTPVEQIVAELQRRRGIEPGPLLRLLSADRPPEGSGVGALLDAIRQLESAADECLQPRRGAR
jgi:hypothetical protein